jgi:hypothetical protein
MMGLSPAWVLASLAGVLLTLALMMVEVWRVPPGSREIQADRVFAGFVLWALVWAFGIRYLLAVDPARRVRRNTWVVVIAGAVAVRVALLFATPHFSDDLWRHLWEGKVQTLGFNPYANSPLSFAGTEIAETDPFWPHVNYPEISAIYPPLAQMVFGVVADLWYSPVAMKLVMVLADLGTLALLVPMLRRRGLGPGTASGLAAVLTWAWAPLVCFEVAGSGHVDALAAFFIILWLDCLERRRESAAAAALGLAIAVKLVPVLLLPVALRWHRRRWTVALTPVVAAVLFVPHLDWDSIRSAEPGATLVERVGLDDLTRALREYENRWRHNESAFLLVYEGVIALALQVEGEDAETEPRGLLGGSAAHARAAARGEVDRRENSAALRLAKWICYGAFLLGLGVVLWRARSAVSASLAVLGLWIIFSPVVHPWYLLLVLPLAILERRVSWLVLSVTALFTYVTVEDYLRTGVWHESRIAWALEWGTFYPLLLWELIRRRAVGAEPTAGGLPSVTA